MRFLPMTATNVFLYSRYDFVECLGNGASLEALIKMVNKNYMNYSVMKVYVDEGEVWSDMLSFL